MSDNAPAFHYVVHSELVQQRQRPTRRSGPLALLCW